MSIFFNHFNDECGKRERLRKFVAGRCCLFVIAALSTILALSAPAHSAPQWQTGDIIFQTSRSSQSVAIQLATHSTWSHMGVILLRKGKPCVFEAGARVECTPLGTWIARGVRGQFFVKRIRHPAALTKENIEQLESVARTFEGKPYDPTFEWSDTRMYCSELVWKLFERALGIQVGELAKLGSFDLTSAPVKQKMAERYKAGPPLDEVVISPQAMFASSLLVDVPQR